MSEVFGILVVFFFEKMNNAEQFLRTGNVELSSARKMVQVPQGGDITADIISADTGIIAPVMLVYSLIDIEPMVLNMTGQGRIDSAS